jgi:hypothetical protein
MLMANSFESLRFLEVGLLVSVWSMIMLKGLNFSDFFSEFRIPWKDTCTLEPSRLLSRLEVSSFVNLPQ